MSTLSIAELFKIDNKYFRRDLNEYNEIFKNISVSHLPTLVENDVFIGIEVELEKGVGIPSSGERDCLWSWRGDGSLRNNGMEAVSIPVNGKWIAHAINSLFTTIKHCSFSPRTSIHIHLDVRKFTQKQLTAFLLVYLSVESLMYKYVGKDRHENIYCVPLYTTTLVQSLVDLINKNILRHDFGHNRYAGLNLDALRKFGTVEFRQMHGTHDVIKLTHWINLIFKIYQFAMKHSLDELLTKIMDLNTNSFYIAYLNEVFGELVQLFDISDVKTDLEKGVKAVKQSIISNKFSSELRKEFSRLSPASQRYALLHKNSAYVLSYFQ